jgi:hypothetical protein
MSEEKLAKRVRDLHALLGAEKSVADVAREQLLKLLVANSKTWNDIPEFLAVAAGVEAKKAPAQDPQQDPREATATAPEGKFNILTVVHHMVETYVSMRPDERVAVALWILHTHVFDRFMVTPRLAMTSPVRGCGKTTLLDIIKVMARRAHKCDGISAAVFYHRVDRNRSTMLIDEVDNLPLSIDGPMRAAFNAGHRRGGTIERMLKGAPRAYQVFTPMAIAAIGALPLPLSHRSITIRLTRYAGDEPLRRFDPDDTADLDYCYQQLTLWAQTVKLCTDPEMPAGLRNRPADNWRPLIAIADSFGKAWGETAREAALAFSRGYRDEDIGVVLLRDIRDLFETHGVDRFASAALVTALCELDSAPWAEWRGIRDDQSPRRLSRGELAKMLAPFGIRPKSVWPVRRHDTGKSSTKGYTRDQFEHAWAAYCSEAGTPAQSRPNAKLRAV